VNPFIRAILGVLIAAAVAVAAFFAFDMVLTYLLGSYELAVQWALVLGFVAMIGSAIGWQRYARRKITKSPNQ